MMITDGDATLNLQRLAKYVYVVERSFNDEAKLTKTWKKLHGVYRRRNDSVRPPDDVNPFTADHVKALHFAILV